MNYRQGLQYLEQVQSLGVRLGLDTVNTLLSSLGSPHQKYPSVLVAGTNGKGSVCAMLTQILTDHGFHVGFYSSPHLVRVEERIRIGKDLIPARDFCLLLTAIREKIEFLLKSKELASHPTYFEILTCLALLYFEKKKVDIAVLEVGLGGRYDAANVVTPLVSVIATVSRDHQEYLGTSLSQIALEKAGIIKPGIPLVCGVKKGEAYEVIRKRAKELNVPFYGVFEKPSSFCVKRTQKGYCFSYNSKKDRYVFCPKLRGKHQGRNAAVAIAASEELSKSWKRLEKKKILKGIEDAEWEGRLEVISHKPLMILDGSHNEEGAKALRAYIQDFIPSPLILVFGAMRDKAIGKMGRILFPRAQTVILTQLSSSRAASAEEIRALIPEFQARMILEPDPKTAYQTALNTASSQGNILFTGSLFLVGEIKKLTAKFPKGRPFL